jgi:hypothetical protein
VEYKEALEILYAEVHRIVHKVPFHLSIFYCLSLLLPGALILWFRYHWKSDLLSAMIASRQDFVARFTQGRYELRKVLHMTTYEYTETWKRRDKGLTCVVHLCCCESCTNSRRAMVKVKKYGWQNFCSAFHRSTICIQNRRDISIWKRDFPIKTNCWQ